MAEFGKQRFPEKYQTSVGMSARNMLHDNSRELVGILKENNVIDNKSTVFELGSGPARNLHYILKEYPTSKLYCSDLFLQSSFDNMSNEIKEAITFYEGDSQDIIDNNVIKDLDLFLISDHLMHLQYEKADYIIKKIISYWKPKHIMLRETTKEFEMPHVPKLFHDYNQFLIEYDLIEQTISKQCNAYFIWLLKRK